jgi:hypothetical protein
MGWTTGVRFLEEAENFSIRHSLQTGSGAHSASCAMDVKLAIHLHLAPRSRVRGSMPPLPQYVFTALCLVKHRENFTFYL